MNQSKVDSDKKAPIKIRVIKGITEELSHIAIPEDIRREANEIFISQDLQVRKGQKMNYALFYCIYTAYKKLGKCQVPKTVANLVGIQASEISKAISTFSSSGKKNTSPSKDFVSFIELIPAYCIELGIDTETTVQIQEFGRDLQSRFPDLDEKFPQNIAAGMILYFMTIHGVGINKREFSTKIQLSDVTISTSFKLIKTLHNSC